MIERFASVRVRERELVSVHGLADGAAAAELRNRLPPHAVLAAALLLLLL